MVLSGDKAVLLSLLLLLLCFLLLPSCRDCSCHCCVVDIVVVPVVGEMGSPKAPCFDCGFAPFQSGTENGGKPSEKNIYADIDAAWQALRTRYGISPQNIILYGQSIGTVSTVDLASRYEVGAVILHSPLMSGMWVAFPETKRTWFFDPFPR